MAVTESTGGRVQASMMDQNLVRALLREQHPDLADLPLREVDGGWDNQQWRLGDTLAVRMPRTERAPALMEKERTWLPVLAERLPLPTPVPVRSGVVSALFPHTWTIARWVEGEPADTAPITHPDAAAMLAAFLVALHLPSPPDAPVNPPRGLPLSPRLLPDTAWGAVDGTVDVVALHSIWGAAVSAPDATGPAVWLHADLHPANVTVSDGKLVGVLDFGDLCSGDPAIDLAAAWVLLPADRIGSFFDAYGHVDDATIARARGWALWRALGLIGIGRNGRLGRLGGKPTWEPAGYATLQHLLATG